MTLRIGPDAWCMIVLKLQLNVTTATKTQATKRKKNMLLLLLLLLMELFGNKKIAWPTHSPKTARQIVRLDIRTAAAARAIPIVIDKVFRY